MGTRETAKTILTNTLLGIPGTNNWGTGQLERVAEKLLTAIEEVGGLVTFPEGEPMIRRKTIQEIRMARLIRMDREDRPLN